MSDSHDNWDNLKKAVEISNNQKCEYLLFAGDLIAPTGILFLEEFVGKVKFIWGNNEGEIYRMTQLMAKTSNVELCGDVFEDELDGTKIFMNHYPRIVELAAKSGEFGLCIYGHTHTYDERMIGDTLLLNPADIQGYKTGTGTFVIFDTATKKAEKIELK